MEGEERAEAVDDGFFLVVGGDTERDGEGDFVAEHPPGVMLLTWRWLRRASIRAVTIWYR
jgi:hypothetical protein